MRVLKTIRSYALILFCAAAMALVYQILVFQNTAVQNRIEVLDTYVYRVGLLQGSYSFASAAGLFKSAVGLVFVVAARTASRRLTQSGGSR